MSTPLHHPGDDGKERGTTTARLDAGVDAFSDPRPEETTSRKRPSRPRPEKTTSRKRPSGPRPEETTSRKRPSRPRPEETTSRERPSRPRPGKTTRVDGSARTGARRNGILEATRGRAATPTGQAEVSYPTPKPSSRNNFPAYTLLDDSIRVVFSGSTQVGGSNGPCGAEPGRRVERATMSPLRACEEFSGRRENPFARLSQGAATQA